MPIPFLLEIGTEEIPDWMIPGALDSLRDNFAAVLDKAGFAGVEFKLDATPRRLALRAAALPERQADAEEKLSGPPKSANPNAVAGFAKKLGIAPDALVLETTPKGEYYTYTRKVAGRATRDILAEALPQVILKIAWPKTMFWTGGKNGPRFIRPIRWLVALLGEEIVPFEVAGVPAGRESSGHRKLGRNRFPVSYESYERALRDNGVILSAEERRKKILDGIAALGVTIHPDAALLETLVYITECPTPIVGTFEDQFLALPDEVRTTVMRHHQKYFTAEGTQFVAVMNTAADPEGLVRRGNERVLRARFNDARFFWDADQKKKLADRVEDLKAVTFQAKLGSYHEKTERVMSLVRSREGSDAAVRAAQLSKCDLTTELVKEFTELQGVVGGLYARAQGEPEEVWQAIYDHYKPVSMEDSIPRNAAGQMVSLCDKVDTLRGCFSVGLIPTGSKDPFALRRAAQGAVKILVEGSLDIRVRPLLGGNEKLEEFFLDRVRYYFRDVRGFQYDEVNAVLAAGWNDLKDVSRRLEAIQTVRPTANFEPLAASFKRVKNILRQAEFAGGSGVDAALLEAGPEADLYAEMDRVQTGARVARTLGNYADALAVIATLRPALDLFFDKVLVNAPDPKVRQNRLTLLHTLLTEFSAIADFSEIVTSV